MKGVKTPSGSKFIKDENGNIAVRVVSNDIIYSDSACATAVTTNRFNGVVFTRP